ncbi:hypothetical protein AB0J63_44780 [Streptosporangium canum]|uniref:hypothetical protein n=1 Tax=Streptosporangium canum TaxID=324952 RepID=UPI00343E3D44
MLALQQHIPRHLYVPDAATDLDRHNATPLLRAFMDELSEHIEGAPEAYFGAMRSPYPAIVA